MSAPLETPVADAVRGNWVDRHAPARLRPYLRLARLDRPIGTWLLLFPGWWSIALAAQVDGGTGFAGRLPDLWLILLFAIGAVAMRGAGCTYNDIVDRDFDAQVERTRSRPIPSGAVSVTAAWAFLLLQSLIGLAVLLTFNRFAIILGAASLLLVAAYPFMKRITWWPQAWLGITFNYGALLGWAAATGTLHLPALVLYAAGIAWTLGYDTIYAHQDKDDDALIGVKSSARALGKRTRPFLWMIYALTLALLGLAGALAGIGWGYYAGLVLAALHLGWQAARVRPDDPDDCLSKFRANAQVGWIVLLAIVFGQMTVA